MLSVRQQVQPVIFMAGLLYLVEQCTRNFCTRDLGRTPEESDALLCRWYVTLENLRNISDCALKA